MYDTSTLTSASRFITTSYAAASPPAANATWTSNTYLSAASGNPAKPYNEVSLNALALGTGLSVTDGAGHSGRFIRHIVDHDSLSCHRRRGTERSVPFPPKSLTRLRLRRALLSRCSGLWPACPHLPDPDATRCPATSGELAAPAICRAHPACSAALFRLAIVPVDRCLHHPPAW